VNYSKLPGKSAGTATGIRPQKKACTRFIDKNGSVYASYFKKYEIGGETDEKLRNRKKYG
jgi:hypothetical protein